MAARRAAFLRRHAALFILLAAAFIIRIFIFRNIIPVINTDSVTYLVLKDLGPIRTPGYPLFIEAIQFFNDLFSITPRYLRLIVFFQMFVLGLVNTFLVYSLAKRLARSEAFGVFMGLIFNLDYFVIGFELLLLTETLTFTFLGLTLLFYLKIFEGKRSAPYWAGLFSVLLVLTRPTYTLLFALFAGLTGLITFREIVKKGFLKRQAKPLAVFVLINLVGIGAWSLRNKAKYDYFGISLILPYQLGYYTTHFYQKYKMGSDPELDKYARIFIQEKGMPYDFAYRLRTELGLSEAQTAEILLKLNVKLIEENFGDYLKRIPTAARDYYDYSWYWTLPHDKRLFPRIGPLAGAFKAFQGIYRPIFGNFVAWLAFVLLVPAAFLITSRYRKDTYHSLWLMEGVIQYNFLISILLTNAGINNLRFRVPVEPLILMVFYAALFTWGRDVFVRTLKTGGRK